jgi:iron complex outermembrane receptor protein
MLHSLALSVLLAAGGSPDTLVVPMKEIEVQSSRVRESLLRTPAAVTVVDRARFANGRSIALDDALTGVPGVLVQSRGGAQDVRITIRGYGARGNGDRSNAGSMRGIRVLTDGIPISEPDGRTSLDLVNMGATDRVDVSRSNVSALYGNASGGVVDLRTNVEFDRPYARWSETAGAFGLRRDQLSFGFAAGRARGVVTGSNTTFDGWRDHSGSHSAQVQARMAVPLGDDARDRVLVLADFANNLIRFPGALTPDEYAADPEQANPTYVARDERRYNRVGRLAGTLEHSLGASQDLSATLYVEPKALQRSERGRYRDFTRYHVGGQAVWSLRETLAPGVLGRTEVGMDDALQDGAIVFWDVTPDGDRGTTQVANKREGANGFGLFAQQSATWHDTWSVQGALRYDRLRYISEDFLDPALSDRKTFEHLTPKLSVSRFLGDHTVFAALGGGVESPAFNEIDPPPPFHLETSLNPFLQPMVSTTYELGARGSFANRWGRWRYDSGLYWIETKNDIVPFNGGAYFYTAGRSRRIGVEGSLECRPTSRLTLRGSGAASNNEYEEYQNDAGDFAGKEMPGLPSLAWTASARVELSRGFGAELSTDGMSEYYADDANTAKTFAYGLVHAAVDWTMTSGARSVRAFVTGRNLLDTDHIASVYINPLNDPAPNGPPRYIEPGLPRNFSLGFSVQF